MLIECLEPLRIHLRLKAVELIPGQQIELSDDDGQRLLTKAPDAVRQVIDAPESRITSNHYLRMTNPPKVEISSTSIDITPAASGANQVYWETGTGQILGPAAPEFLMRDGETFWIVTTFRGQIRWISADLLRSKKAFDAQRRGQPVQLHRKSR